MTVIQTLKKKIKGSPAWPWYRRVRIRVLILMGKAHPIQAHRAASSQPLLHLGSVYGGWTLVDDPALKGATIISAGLGEDASFDLEFAVHFDARVVIVDPTPRAIAHFESMMGHLGQPATQPYAEGGSQPTAAYSLERLRSEQLVLEPIALWNKAGTIKFFMPKDKDHVSHSIVNFQNAYAQDTDHIEVGTATLTAVADAQGVSLSQVPLLKLDIEGAEIEVIEHLLAGSDLPTQILVEFDELLGYTRRAVERVEMTHQSLLKAGYELLYCDGQTDFLYYRDPQLVARM